jgi:hypothetical protein
VSEIAVDFLAGIGWISRGIAQFGFPQGYSHCASVGVFAPFKEERYIDARDNVIAGVPAGVHIREPATEKWVRKQRASLPVTQAEFDAWEASLRAKITTDYDRDAILGFLEGKSIHTAGRWICSALAINAVQHIKKVRYPLSIPAHEISPDTALLILDTAGFTIGPIQTPSP